MRAAVIGHLAWGMLRSVGGRTWTRDDGLTRFKNSFAPDGLVPWHPDDRALTHVLSGCLGCGACETVDPSPRSLLAALRALPETRPDVRTLDARTLEDALASVESACPAGIPFSRLPAILERMVPGGEPRGDGRE